MSHILSPDERVEYEQLLHDAAHDDNGRLLPSGLAVARAHTMLIDAVKAGRAWAEIEMERALTEGIRSEVRRYLKRSNTRVQSDITGSRVRPAVYSVRRPDPDGGSRWQMSLFEDMSLADLDSFLVANEPQIVALVANRDAARTLRRKLISTGASTVREALAKLGQSLDEALSEAGAR